MRTEREKFLSWWERNKSLDCDEYSAFEIWQAAKASAIPEGFVLVEIEKLHEIRDQALDAKYTSLDNDSYRIFSVIDDVQLSIETMIEAGELK